MTTIYRVEYSETHGYYVREQPALQDSYGKWIAADVDENGEFNAIDHGEVFNYSDGWRKTEGEAIEMWRVDAMEAAKAYRNVSYDLETMACGSAPVTVQNRIKKPELK